MKEFRKTVVLLVLAIVISISAIVNADVDTTRNVPNNVSEEVVQRSTFLEKNSIKRLKPSSAGSVVAEQSNLGNFTLNENIEDTTREEGESNLGAIGLNLFRKTNPGENESPWGFYDTTGVFGEDIKIVVKYDRIAEYNNRTIGAIVTVKNFHNVRAFGLAKNFWIGGYLLRTPTPAGASYCDYELNFFYTDEPNTYITLDANSFLTICSIDGTPTKEDPVQRSYEGISFRNTNHTDVYLSEQTNVVAGTVDGMPTYFSKSTNNYTDTVTTSNFINCSLMFHQDAETWKTTIVHYRENQNYGYWFYFRDSLVSFPTPENPVKTVNDKTSEEAKAGTTITYSISQKINTTGDEGYGIYDKFEIIDELPAEVDYVSGSLLCNGTDVTANAGSLNYNQADHTVKYTFSANYLNNLAFQGQTFKLNIIAKLNDTSLGSASFTNAARVLINDATLYSNEVRVTPIKVTVTYDAKGGAPTPDTEYLKVGDLANPNKTPTKTGYTLEGWRKTGDTTNYDFSTPVTEDINLDAQWKAEEYKITYVLNGGTNDATNPTRYTINDDITFKPATRDGYNFLGWYEDANFTTPKNGISHETGDKTVYAKWEMIEVPQRDAQYKVEYYKEKTSGVYELAVSETFSDEIGKTVAATPKAYTGYAENKEHAARKASGEVTADGKLVLKLYYDKLKYVVTFDPQNGGTIPSQTVPYMEKAVEPTKPVKDGYEFQYWYYLNDNKGKVQYNFDDPVTRNIDLIAQWKEVTYNINYVLDGGKNNSENPSTFKVSDTVTFKDPTKDGYKFLGWYTESEFKTKIEGFSNRAEDITVYAKWEKINNEKPVASPSPVIASPVPQQQMLPQTGVSNTLAIIIAIAVAVAIVIGIRYRKFKDIK